MVHSTNPLIVVIAGGDEFRAAGGRQDNVLHRDELAAASAVLGSRGHSIESGNLKRLSDAIVLEHDVRNRTRRNSPRAKTRAGPLTRWRVRG
jgi:hypothetical protein